jgi:hypothetical protein
MFRFPGTLCLGGFLAISGALWGQPAVAPQQRQLPAARQSKAVSTGSVTTGGAQTLAPQGGEFLLLGSIPGDQVWPTVSLSPSGGAITWQDNNIDKGGGGLGNALLNTSFAAGNKVRVNNTTTGNHYRPKVQLLANDNAVYVWESSVTATGVPSIYARFAKNANAKTSPGYGTNFYTGDIRVNTDVKSQKIDPAVAALPDGSAIIVWSSFGQDGDMYGVFARQIKSTGAGATAKEFQVNQVTSSNQRNPAVAALPNGNYVIVWVSERERSATSADVYARIFTDAGVPLTDEIPINSGSSPCSSPSVAALGDGGFTVVWAQKDMVAQNNGWDVWGRAFSASGLPLALDFGINTFLYGDQYQPRIAAGPAGSLVVWTSLGEDGSREGVYGRFLAGGAQVSGDEFRVNTTTISQQMHPSVAWDGVGSFLVVWTSFTGQQGFDLFGQRYTVNSSLSQ